MITQSACKTPSLQKASLGFPMSKVFSGERPPIGEWVFNERENKGLTQKELADLLGVASETMSRYETGKRRIDRILVVKIARALGINPEPGLKILGLTPSVSVLNESPASYGQELPIPNLLREVADKIERSQGLDDQETPIDSDPDLKELTEIFLSLPEGMPRQMAKHLVASVRDFSDAKGFKYNGYWKEDELDQMDEADKQEREQSGKRVQD